jgi:hypothetical protein
VNVGQARGVIGSAGIIRSAIEPVASERQGERTIMVDATTNKPLRVSTSETRPYLMLPESQLEDVQRLLDRHGFRYWVEDEIVSFEGSPPEAMITFYRDVDAAKVQAVLDSAG